MESTSSYRGKVALSVFQEIYRTKRVINLPKDCVLERGNYLIDLQKEGAAPVESSGNPDEGEWKKGFSELYNFFHEVLENIEQVVPTEDGQDLWNDLLAKRDKQLIGKLRKEANL